ncbi:MAG: phosphoenolpyruvate synthase [Candidatus Sedimenticola endophacoides]|uniref:Phosphoenolpyruvate synthase n=2 Tax=Candidatus Sedimenticola endophacoides TaxID=2548426 RepID=A0A6N4E2I6_9GAMM|nr:MAG: phosphoenolpyruvate synthase [Candidatus Sedimenticola endophacoides]OQX36596.1 MAG: phosphoenolpyruvate synthase [Candidatus Sedimenticola endophacoides]OQX41461.1 MAG: phosphoenolpyruvate synthase [Candidatus Sedimenticola endophacoides]PUD98376.1 MAG: phosphoenolpyruvate synthase [Candidatus Sedimenticola endophacoides]PUE01284.1 MAG: phosphoenolpyruvate synthase [Candidatus Sedimenticola endophacoides]
MSNYVQWLSELGMDDVEHVGGKNASLGEMIQNLSNLGVAVPGGFATTAHAYREFLATGGLAERINDTLARLDVDDVRALASAGAQIRQWVMETPFQPPLEQAIDAAYATLEKEYGSEVTWAVRSSATAEDLPDASFAGQQETFLNVSGLANIKRQIHEVFASLFNDRAIAYRVHQGFEHSLVALSAGVQKMIRSDIGASGVMFTLDTESGFRDAVFITASYGLGEMVVQGAVNPDEFYVHKPTLEAGRPAVLRRNVGGKAIQMIYDQGGPEPVKIVDVEESARHRFSITDAEAEELARQALTIERHYQRPMDIEWARDGIDGRLYIVQARPETVQSRTGSVIERYKMQQQGTVIAQGRSIGGRIGAGTAKVIMSLNDMEHIQPGDVLVTDMTDPDWEPIMKRAAAIVTNRGGRTCHAAIIARELGVPAVVGCNDATHRIADGQAVTVSCAEGDTGFIYDGLLEFEYSTVEMSAMPEIPTKIMMNVGNPDRAFDFAAIPNAGIGLARLEFIINNMIGIHPRALLEFDRLPQDLREQITPMIAAYESPREFYIAKIAEGVSTLAAAFTPGPVIVRMSDFKSNEYANLIAGPRYEPEEENPMIGFRGASRYISEDFRACWEMECEALKRVRNEMGLTNVEIMIPFVRTLDEAAAVVDALAENGLRRGENGLRLIMMCELPSNAVLAEEFLEYFDGFSIGSNDMTQLTLGLDRDSALIAQGFDERNPAVKKMLSMAIGACKARGKYVGICGQGPSDHPDLAKWLLDQGISSVSLNPDTVIDTWLFMAGQQAD